MDFVANLRGMIAQSSRSNFGGGVAKSLKKSNARSRPRNPQRELERFICSGLFVAALSGVI